MDRKLRHLAAVSAFVWLASGPAIGVAPVGAQQKSSGEVTRFVNCDREQPGALQRAVNTASAGKTILVNGTCYENVSIPVGTDQITLDGQGHGVINGPDPTLNGILVRGRGITITGLTITGGRVGIDVGRGASAVIDGIERTGRFDRQFFVMARTSLPPESLGNTLQSIVRSIDPEMPVSDLLAMEARVTDSLVARRSPALLAGLFSALALLLTAIGTYGVLSYAVAQRRREIGLRMALGARPEQVRAQFLSIAVRLLACGTAIGFLGAWLAGRAMGAVLFQVPALHTPTLAAAAVVLATVSMIACALPSHRAARISPMEAMASD
jgi:hypothetical protein